MNTTKHNITNTAEPIKPGYKKTKVGIIPEDWEVKRIKSVADVIGGGTPSTTEVKYWNGNINWFTPSEIKGKFVSKSERKITKAGLKNSSAKELPIGTILLTTRATIGEASLSTEISTTNQGFQSLVCKNGTNNVFLYELIKFNKNELYRRANGSTFLEISGKEVRKIPLAIPPLPEQKAIADCLSTWDKGIEKLSALIASKKEQKKGLMQQLLTGKKRLDGFTEEWKEVRLGEITKRITRKNKELDDTVVTISAQRGFVLQEDYFKKRVASSTLSNYYLLHKGEFAYNKSYSKGYPMGAFKRLDDFDKAVVTTLYICFKLKENVDSDFLLDFFEAGLMINNLMRIAQEGGRAHGLLNIGLADFFNLKLRIPDINEQRAIAEVLTTANKEIELLEKKLESYKTQKKGLMQVLLTGTKRLVES